MQVAHLTEYGVPQIVVDSWREKLGEELLPVQKRAVVDCQVLSGKSLLIAAPTSSGKTFCGELAAVAGVFKRKKALFVLPLKSIAEERYADFRARYAGLGIRVAISTADRKEYDADIERGRFDIGILVYEKFNQLLVKNIDLLAAVDLLLVDEVQMISEPERGWCLELALLKVLNSGYQPQIIALSAVLSDAALLAQWLGCQLLEDHFRPVELRQGVLWNGQLRYREFNGRNDGSESLSECTGDDAEELLLANVEHLVNSGEQVLVFLKTKRNCEQLATALAERNFWNPAAMATARIKTETGSVLGRRLEQTLSSAVAFHHADLSYTQRRILEAGFRNGEIRVLVSTTTLAMGVNLPAQTVFIDCYKYQIGSRSGRPMVTPLSWSEYEGMSGRAGRYGIPFTPCSSPIERLSMRPTQSAGRNPFLPGTRANQGRQEGIPDSACSGKILDGACANCHCEESGCVEEKRGSDDEAICAFVPGEGESRLLRRVPHSASPPRTPRNDSPRISSTAHGRRGEEVFGRSVLIAGSRAEAETMWQTYVEGKPGRLESRLAGKSLYDVVLDLIASRCACRSDDVGMLLLKSFHSLQGGSFNNDVIATVIDKLAELKLVFIKDGNIEASPIGALISRRGVGVASGMMMVSFCQRYQICDRQSWLYFTLSLPDANVQPVYLSRDEESCACYRRRLCDYVAANAAVSDELRKMVLDDYVLSCEQNVRIKAAFLLLEWIGEKETAGIELDYHINLGSILQVAETTAWLLDTAAGVTALLNRPHELTEQLRQLAEAINCGFDFADTDLADAGLVAEQRDIARRLFNAGIVSAGDFCDGNRDRITAIAGEELAGRLIEKFTAKYDNEKQSSQEVEMSQLRLRGLMRGDRVYFNFKNTEIDITPKSYNYLYKLTVARFLKPEGWLSKDEIEPGFNQAKNIYRVKQELKRFATGLEQRIENNGSGFYRINLSLEQIKIDFDSMKSFCDLELAELTKQVEGQGVC